MDILKLNKIVIVGFIICFFSCEEIHKKPKGYCNKYISGGMGMNFSLNGDIKNNELKSINIKSKIKGNLNYFKKITKVKQLVIGDSILLKDTLFLKFKDKTYKIHSFKNGPLEVFTSDMNWKKKQENCFLESMSFNGEIIKRESNLTFKITLPN